jgi:ribose transport system substrate-binding protein
MKRLRFLVSLTNDTNDYQIEQAVAAQEAARRLDVDVQIIAADDDGITQSQQLLKIIQSSSNPHPDAIILEPAGSTALPQVARAAASAGIGWVIMNREVDYIGELRRSYQVPVFALSADHEEIGRIQGRQFTALAPQGGNALYIHGPNEQSAARQRTAGMNETKPRSLQVRMIKGQWTEASAYKAVSAWLRLSTNRETPIDLIGAQDDSMAMGARKAFQEQMVGEERERWLKVPFTGCDGMPKTGQSWVRQGTLAATVYVPPITSLAMDMLVKAINLGILPPERTMTQPKSVPELNALTASRARGASAR